METLTNDVLLLKSLTIEDAEVFYSLYDELLISNHFDKSPFLPDEKADEFTGRMMESCTYIWTIRLQSNPVKVIGDAALHHWDQRLKSIEIGGSLLPEYWGKNLMRQAFELIIAFVRQTLQIEQIIGKTNPTNDQAIKMVKKLGFEPAEIIENELILKLYCR